MAEVGEDGTVKGLTAGKAVITAETGDGSHTATCEVTVSIKEIKPTGITVDQKTASLYTGETVRLAATVAPDDATDKTVKWSSSDDRVAEVSEDGTVKGLTAGKAVITAETGDGSHKATCEVTVTQSKSKNNISTVDNTKHNNETASSTGSALAQRSSDVAVNENVKGTVAATANSGKKGTVLGASRNIVIVAGEKISIANRFSGKMSKYVSSDKKIATVTNKGIITGKKAGTVTVTAYSRKDKKYVSVGSCTVTVEKPVLKKKAVASIGNELDGYGWIKGLTVTADSWTSSNKKVATVDSLTGRITVTGKGTAKITAQYGKGKNAAKYVTTLQVNG